MYCQIAWIDNAVAGFINKSIIYFMAGGVIGALNNNGMVRPARMSA